MVLKKIVSGKLLQVKCPKEKGTFPQKQTKWYPQPCSFTTKGTPKERGIMFSK
jgi:hypothetical protein